MRLTDVELGQRRPLAEGRSFDDSLEHLPGPGHRGREGNAENFLFLPFEEELADFEHGLQDPVQIVAAGILGEIRVVGLVGFFPITLALQHRAHLELRLRCEFRGPVTFEQPAIGAEGGLQILGRVEFLGLLHLLGCAAFDRAAIVPRETPSFVGAINHRPLGGLREREQEQRKTGNYGALSHESRDRNGRTPERQAAQPARAGRCQLTPNR